MNTDTKNVLRELRERVQALESQAKKPLGKPGLFYPFDRALSGRFLRSFSGNN
jgi:hypothetical protein